GKRLARTVHLEMRAGTGLLSDRRRARLAIHPRHRAPRTVVALAVDGGAAAEPPRHMRPRRAPMDPRRPRCRRVLGARSRFSTTVIPCRASASFFLSGYLGSGHPFTSSMTTHPVVPSK